MNKLDTHDAKEQLDFINSIGDDTRKVARGALLVLSQPSDVDKPALP